MTTDRDRTGVDYVAQVLETIRAIREEHGACTMREVARLLRQRSTTTMSRQLHQLKEWDLVTWTDLPGSLRNTPKGGKFITAVRSGKITEMTALTGVKELTP